jgi:hypothetical protein
MESSQISLVEQRRPMMLVALSYSRLELSQVAFVIRIYLVLRIVEYIVYMLMFKSVSFYLELFFS